MSQGISNLSSLLPTIIEAFSPRIDVPATMSIFILLFASALNTPQPKAPKEPLLGSINAFSGIEHCRIFSARMSSFTILSTHDCD
jgi:hypothetical protein